MKRDRSISRDPENRLKAHILQCVPPTVDLKLFGLYFFSTFSRTGIPTLALFHSLRVLWSEGICIQYRGGYHYYSDPKCEKMAAAINRRNPIKTLHRMDVAVFVRDVHGLQVMHRRTKVLTTVASPCQRISQGIHHGNNLSAEVGPHAYPSSLFWTAHAGLISMAASIPRTSQIVVAEMVPAAVPSWEEQFSAAIGPSTEINVQNGAERRRFYRTSPVLPPQIHILDWELCTTASFSQFPDKCTWRSGKVKPPTLRSIYPVLLERQAINAISASDAITLQKFRIHKPDGSERYAGPVHLAHWLELPEDVITDITAAFPCEPEPIDPLQKFTASEWRQKCSAPPDLSILRPCGEQVLCKNCTEAAELLGRAWNFSSAVSVLTATIRVGFTTTDAGSFTDFANMCPHFCTSPCPFVHTLEQAKGRTTCPDVPLHFIQKVPVCLP